MATMKCRKCGMIQKCETFQDNDDFQKLDCGMGGTHKTVGIK